MSVQAVTRVNAEQASKKTMRRPTRQPFRGRLIRLGEVSKALVTEPKRFGLDLVMPCFFLVMLVPLWRGLRRANPMGRRGRERIACG
jgi:hypothetical protein